MMKSKLSVLGMLLGLIAFNSCDDEMGTVGTTIQPDRDVSTVYADTFTIQASTVLIDSIYAKSVNGLLGEFYDPLFGDLKSDYICQFYMPEDFRFKQVPIDGKIDSVDLRIYYDRTWVGDSLAPMRLEAYPVVRQLEQNYYTNINPADYADLTKSYGGQTYTARPLNVSDSLWSVTDSYGDYSYQPCITVRFPKEFGQKFYEETVNNPATFANQQSFNQYFPGLYITNSFGSGNILTVLGSYLTIYYKYLAENYLGVRDSVVQSGEMFNVTNEVVQMNRFKNTDIDHLLEPSNEYTYMKTPAGIFTKLEIPTKEIISKIQGRKVNNFYFTMKAMPQTEWKYTLTPPTYLLLIPEDSVQTFFEGGSLANSVTTYLSDAYSSATLSYAFKNISNLLKNQMEVAPDEDLNMVAIPVEVTTQTDSYYGTTTVTRITNYLKPSGVVLRKDDGVMRIQVLSSQFAQ